MYIVYVCRYITAVYTFIATEMFKSGFKMIFLFFPNLFYTFVLLHRHASLSLPLFVLFLFFKCVN